MKGQRQWVSTLEAAANTITGYLLALLTQVIVFPLYGIHVSHAENLQIVTIFTAVTFVRSYAWRRFFNWLHHK